MKATIYDGTTTRDYSAADSQVLSPDTPYVWVDVVGDNFSDPDLHTLLGDLGIDDPVLAYLRQTDVAGTFALAGDRLVGSTWAAPDDPNGKPVYVHVVWGVGSIVTLRAGGDKAMARVRQEVENRGKSLFAHPTIIPGVLLELIISSVDRRLTDINDGLYQLDEKIMVHASGAQLAQLGSIRDAINPWGRRLAPYNENLKEALVDTSSIPGMDANGVHYLQAYAAHVSGTVNQLSDLLDSLHSVVQDYQTEMTTRQGNRVNQLTVVATIFLPITFMTGYFGQNFQWLSNATMTFADWLLLGVVLPLTLVTVSMVLLRRRGFGQWLVEKRRKHRHRAKPTATVGATKS